MPDVIERRECPECGFRSDADECPYCDGPLVTRRYVAVDALLRDDVVEAAAEALCVLPARHPDGLAHGDTDEDHPGIMARAALAAAVKHLTGDTTEETR